jgi:hypothetical protein
VPQLNGAEAAMPMTGPKVAIDNPMIETRQSSILSRALIAFVLVPIAWCAWFTTGNVLRMLCGIGCVVFSGLAVAFVFGHVRRAFVATGLAVALLALSPLEVALATRHGLPGVVPVLPGLPGPKGLERARRGEVVLAGCMITGFEPRWVVVW